jgi:hypothetical protein
MILRSCALVICLLPLLAAPFHSPQPQTQRQAAQPPPNANAYACRQGRCVVDLCALATQLDNKKAQQITVGPHQFRVHDEIRLHYGKDKNGREINEQIIWACSTNKGFQITQIHRVRPEGDTGLDMPFDPTLYKEKLRAPQTPGAQLASGPPVYGSDGTYKFSFIIAGDAPLCGMQGDPPVIFSSGKRYDPHIIVTGGDGGQRPGPTPTPGPHKDE